MLKAIGLGIILLNIGLIAIYKSVRMALIMILGIAIIVDWCSQGDAIIS